MVKSYLRFELREAFGVVTSPSSNAVFDATARLALCPALENVNVWNCRQGSLVTVLRNGDHASKVTCIEKSPDSRHVAVGYDDGRISLFRVADGVRALQLHGHRGAVTALRYSRDGSLLASGSRDTDVIVWDPLGESGLYRLRGHKGEVTDVAFLERSNRLVTSSKDTLVKVWDRGTQHCVQTVVGHRSEVWSVDANADETRLVTGSSDSELRVFSLGADGAGEAAPAGVLGRASRQRVVRVRFSPSGRTLVCHSADKLVQLLAVRDPESVKRKVRKRRRREARAAAAKAAGGLEGGEDKKKEAAAAAAAAEKENEGDLLADARAEDEFAPLEPLRMSAKVRSVDFSTEPQAGARERLLVALHNNGVRVLDVDYSAKSGKAAPAGKPTVLELPGHRGGVRDVALSEDDTLAATASSDQVKVWNVSSRACIRTLNVASGYALCCVFAPGGRHCLVGTKEGNLEVWSVSSASLLSCVKAHDGPLWAMEVRPDRRGLATGGGDKEIKFWDFELVTSEAGARSLSVVHTRTLKVTDDVLCLAHSPDGRYIAAGLLDCTVKVFYHDSLKFFLSLYGHRLPVLSVSISSDSALLASGSADKNVKLWGLDFGDCHKSIFAHADSVMRVRFVPKTHYFFSCGKDNKVRYWDGDRFEQILQLDGHHAEVWALVVSNAGDFCLTGGNDLSVRLWEKTQEPVFLEEERERHVTEMADQAAAAEMERREVGEAEGSGLVPGGNSTTAVVGVGVAVPGAASAAAAERQLKASERLLEALDLARAEEERFAAHDEVVAAAKRALAARRGVAGDNGEEEQEEDDDDDDDEDDDADLGGSMSANITIPKPPAPNPFLRGYKPDDFVFHQLKLVPLASLEETLLVLPFEAAMRLAAYLDRFVRQGRPVELCVRALMFIVTVHQNQIVSNQAMGDVLRRLRTATRKRLRHHRDEIGFNAAALNHLQRELKASSGSRFFGDEPAKRPRQHE